jgi:hypothetical protein
MPLVRGQFTQVLIVDRNGIWQSEVFAPISFYGLVNAHPGA